MALRLGKEENSFLLEFIHVFIKKMNSITAFIVQLNDLLIILNNIVYFYVLS